MRIIAVLCCFVALVCVATQAQHADHANEQEVLATVERLSQAGLHRDASGLEHLYSKDYFHTNPDGTVMTLSQVLDSYRAPTIFAFESSHSDEQRVLIHSGVAIVNERLSLRGEKKGEGRFTSSFRVTYVLEKQGAEWKVLNSHSSLLAIDPEKPSK